MTSQGIHGIMYPRPGGLGPTAWSREETCSSDPKAIIYPYRDNKVSSNNHTWPREGIIALWLRMLVPLGDFE